MQDLAADGHQTAVVIGPPRQDKRYGIWWLNRPHKTQKRVAVDTPNGREYKTRSKSVLRPRSEWIAVPVPDCGVPPELVDAARNAVKDNRAPSPAGRRIFDLSGGVLYCAACGRRMGGTRSRTPRRTGGTSTTSAPGSGTATLPDARRRSGASGPTFWSRASGRSVSARYWSPAG